MTDNRQQNRKDRGDQEDRVATPEKLDVLANIVTPWEWGLGIILGVLALFLLTWSIFSQFSQRITIPGIIQIKDAQLFRIDSPIHGMAGKIFIKEGAFVQKGLPLLEILSPKNSPLKEKGLTLYGQKILAPANGKVMGTFLEPGQYIPKGKVLLSLQAPGNVPEAYVYFPLKGHQKIKRGQIASVYLKGLSGTRVLEGKVKETSSLPLTRQRLVAQLGNSSLVDILSKGDIILYRAIIELNEAFIPNLKNKGFSWKVPHTDDEFIGAGMLVDVSIVIKKQRPIAMIFPFFEELLQ